ncbi:MAG: shikimate dehydrogenase [Limisphaerales bacterium]
MSEQDFCPELVGSMSQGAAGNPTVAMVEAAFKHHGLHWRYINMEVASEDLGTAVAGAKAMGYRGFNCSMPHKVEVIQHLDGLGESASIMGAVNCVVNRDGKLIGENTDGKGFLKSLQDLIDPAGKHVVLFGAGGASRAVAVELGLVGVKKLTVVNRSQERGDRLVQLLRDQLQMDAQFVAWDGDYEVPDDAEIVINGTSIGLYDADAALALKTDSLREGAVVADVVFNPPQTKLLRDASARGCRVLDGLGMLVNQGVIGVKFWTGIDPDPAVMRQTLEDIFKS